MIPNIRKGSYMRQLLWYLAGPGRKNEHRDQRVLAGDVVTMAVYAGRITQAQAVELARLLDSPRQTLLRGAPVLVTDHKQAKALIAQGMDRKAAYEQATSDHNTWHCSLTLDASEGQLSDETWRGIANDFMRLMGFTGRSDGVPDVRWAAMHHGLNESGGDHIHVAMGVVRPDGSRADRYLDFLRAQAACNKLEHKYGLRVLASREEGGAERATTPAERARAERLGAPETDREALERRVRALAVASSSEAEWIREVQAAGIIISPRFASGGMDEVIGYKVALPPRTNRDGKREKSIEYGGGRLATDMTLPAIRTWASWDRSFEAGEEALAVWREITTSSQQGRRAASGIDSRMSEQQAIVELARFGKYAREIPSEDRDAWAKLASQSAGLFASLSVQTEKRPGPLHTLSRQLARAGQQPANQRRPWGVHGSGLRHVARMVWAAKSPQASNVALVEAMVDCLLAVGQMLEATDRARTAASMLVEAKQALTEIHMRAAGLDPNKPHIGNYGSPAWAATKRAERVLAGGDRDATEAEIRDAYDGWNARRIALSATGRVSYDERGQIVQEVQPRRVSAPTPQAVRRATGQAAIPTQPNPGQSNNRRKPPPAPHRDRGFER
ncbi:hypothetical protein IU470_30135 [Nocardia abscessus]|uniref:MobA/VirD2-like nuclease domain-containing protein n=1 Tax=Nocardia abscessus TaxID=120957 RepID=A0ABS0CIJ4_9NOCA|nr:hypothetical protein [Nocardia abscessus]MBF6229337.1 hypothetical protein [Nocardia abscessus]